MNWKTTRKKQATKKNEQTKCKKEKTWKKTIKCIWMNSKKIVLLFQQKSRAAATLAADFWGLGGNAVHKLAVQKMAT